MANYKRILLAVDFAADNDLIIEKAKQAVQENHAQLLLVHVNEPMATAYSAGPMMAWNTQLATLESELNDYKKGRMQELASQLDIPKDNYYMLYGRAAGEIKRLAEEKEVDLIVIGTHGQHGLGLLLGSTANAVLHGVPCDVLVIRTRESN